MKRIIKSVSVAAVIVIVCLYSFSIISFASDGYTYSSQATTDVWQSDSQQSLVSSFPEVYGGDVGIYFYLPNVGLSSAFVQSLDRTAYSKLYESDAFSDDLVREYTHGFGYHNGLYTKIRSENTYTSSAKIEIDNVVELYFRYKVNSISGDTSRNVTAGLFRYQFWIN